MFATTGATHLNKLPTAGLNPVEKISHSYIMVPTITHTVIPCGTDILVFHGLMNPIKQFVRSTELKLCHRPRPRSWWCLQASIYGENGKRHVASVVQKMKGSSSGFYDRWLSFGAMKISGHVETVLARRFHAPLARLNQG